jgi:hypothetical protein
MSEMTQMLVVGAAVGAAVAFVSTRAWRALQPPAAAESGQCSTGCAGCPVAKTLDSPDDHFAGCAGLETEET